MTVTLPRVALHDVQLPVAGELEHVVDELRRIIAADFPIISEVNEHLLRMKGKLFRPTLLLLSHRAAGGNDPRAVTLAAVVELIHLATLVHDDSVDHSALRRGLRSEEHTSELQSHSDLVCRLLLEKKKKS